MHASSINSTANMYKYMPAGKRRVSTNYKPPMDHGPRSSRSTFTASVSNEPLSAARADCRSAHKPFRGPPTSLAAPEKGFRKPFLQSWYIYCCPITGTALLPAGIASHRRKGLSGFCQRCRHRADPLLLFTACLHLRVCL